MSDDHYADFGPALNVEGTKLQILLRDPYFTDGETGEVTPMVKWMDWSDADVRDKADCQHETTICTECVESWGIDHWIAVLAPDGTRYALNGHPGLPSL